MAVRYRALHSVSGEAPMFVANTILHGLTQICRQRLLTSNLERVEPTYRSEHSIVN